MTAKEENSKGIALGGSHPWMKPLFVSALLLFVLGSRLLAGSALIMSLEEIVKGADVVWVFEIEEIKDVPVDTGIGEGTVVHVAKAKCLQSLKGPENGERRFALVSSSLPSTSAVWKPLHKGKFIGFLTARMGHFEFTDIWWLREVGEDGKVEWVEKDKEGLWVISRIELADAVSKIKAIQKVEDTRGFLEGR